MKSTRTHRKRACGIPHLTAGHLYVIFHEPAPRPWHYARSVPAFAVDFEWENIHDGKAPLLKELSG
jgi:hypothetical protein